MAPAGRAPGRSRTQGPATARTPQPGADRPIWQRYPDYRDRPGHANLGTSYFPPNERVSSDIAKYIVPTLELVAISIALGFVGGVALGIYAASRRGRLGDRPRGYPRRRRRTRPCPGGRQVTQDEPEAAICAVSTGRKTAIARSSNEHHGDLPVAPTGPGP